MKRVDELLDRYFEGETTIAEERWLKDYFKSTSTLPEHLEGYRSLFGYFESERSIECDLSNESAAFDQPSKLRVIWLTVSAVAAACLVYFIFPNQAEHDSSQHGTDVVIAVKTPKVEGPAVVRSEGAAKKAEVRKSVKQQRRQQPAKESQPAVKPATEERNVRDKLEPLDNIKGVEKNLRELDNLREMNKSLSPLSNLAYLQDYFEGKGKNNQQ